MSTDNQESPKEVGENVVVSSNIGRNAMEEFIDRFTKLSHIDRGFAECVDYRELMRQVAVGVYYPEKFLTKEEV